MSHPLTRIGVVLIASIALVLFSPVQAQPSTDGSVPSADSLRLSDLVQQAVSANPDLQAARLEAAARAEKVAQARSWPEPTVGATYFPRSIVTARGAQRSQWRVQQTLPVPGSRSLRGEVAELGADVVHRQTEALQQEVALNVRRAYYTLYRVQRQEQLIRRFQDDLRQAEDVALAQYEVGEEGQPAVLKAQIERERLQVRLESLDAARQRTVQTLARLTGNASLATDGAIYVQAPRRERVVSARVEDALAQRPEVAALQQSVKQAERKVDLVQREKWPDVTVGAQYFDIESTGLTPMMDGRDALALSVGVKIPLWRGAERAQVDEAVLQRRAAESRLDALALDVRTDLQRLEATLDRQERQLRILDATLIPRAETALEATLSAYRTGQSDFLDLLDAERTLFQLQLDRATIFSRLLTTQAEQDRVAGRTAVSDR
ncbi:hypothetical protein CRI94_07025 [Longibacter salinarum]|uniref:Transporter n=1 Tax=Longibacter salinarum TaxID=1850348 RepID=A0A2A8CYL5_9BACT|nr:TolC family protein [Longibacter salinarum]PEN13812.1 hypothetical protein CRI94_07025 [Longibacter salinarum]